MVYDIKAVIPMEIGELTLRIVNLNLNHNDKSIRIELGLIEEMRKVAIVRDVALKRNY